MQSLALLKNAPLDRPCAWVPGSGDSALDIQEALNVRCAYQLRLGGEHQQKVRIVRTDGRPQS